MTPEISVVVCAYNEQDAILACLESLTRQEGMLPASYEVIVVDDGSIDGTGDVVRPYLQEEPAVADLIRYVRISHSGLSVARNTGTYLAQAPVIAFIDADAQADPRWLKELSKAWSENPEAQAIGGRVAIRNSGSRLARMLNAVFYAGDDAVHLIGTNMSFRKTVLEDVRGFAPVFRSRGDESFVYEKLGADRRVVKSEDAIVHHDRPERVGAWIRERFANGKMTLLIAHLTGRDKARWLIHSIAYLLLIAALASLAFVGFVPLIAVVGCYMLYVLARIPLLQKVSDNRVVGPLEGALGLLVSDIGRVAMNVGIFVAGCSGFSRIDREADANGALDGRHIVEDSNKVAEGPSGG